MINTWLLYEVIYIIIIIIVDIMFDTWKPVKKAITFVKLFF